MNKLPTQDATQRSRRRVLARHKAVPLIATRRPHEPSDPQANAAQGLLSPQPVRLGTITARIRSIPETARTLNYSEHARLKIADYLLDHDPEAKERFGDRETLAAFLLAIARRALGS